jgi:flagellar hook-basal body complex protein FliE
MLDAISPIARTPGTAASDEAASSPLTGAAGAASAGKADAPADFGSFLAQMAAGTAQTLKAGESAAIGGVTGQVPTQQVVQAVMTAEQNLQAAIAIRDKVVTAFLEIGRMQI